MKAYLHDIERIVMLKEYDSNPHEDTVTVLFRIVEHGKGGRVNVERIQPLGVGHSKVSEHEFDSLEDATEAMNIEGSELRGMCKGSPVIASKQAVLRWTDRFSHFDIEKMFV